MTQPGEVLDIEVVEVPGGTIVELVHEPDDPLVGATVTAVLVDDGGGGSSGGGGPPTGGAGGVLSGQYPNPGFAVNMATQAELDGHIGSGSPHAVYDDIPSLVLLFENRLV